MHAIETKKLDKAGKNYSAADFLQLSSKIYTNLFIPSNWHKITIRQFERAWVGNALYSVPWVLFELQQPTWNNKPGSAHRPLYFKIARQERELHIYAFILDQPGLFSICISILHLFNPCLGKLWESSSSQSSSSSSPSSSQSLSTWSSSSSARTGWTSWPRFWRSTCCLFFHGQINLRPFTELSSSPSFSFKSKYILENALCKIYLHIFVSYFPSK